MYVYFNLNKILFLYYIRMRFLSQLIDNISIYHINWSMVQCGSSNRFTTLIKKTSLKYFRFAFLSTENLDKSFFYLFLFINEVFLLNSGNALIIILCVLKNAQKWTRGLPEYLADDILLSKLTLILSELYVYWKIENSIYFSFQTNIGNNPIFQTQTLTYRYMVS